MAALALLSVIPGACIGIFIYLEFTTAYPKES